MNEKSKHKHFSQHIQAVLTPHCISLLLVNACISFLVVKALTHIVGTAYVARFSKVF